MTTAEQQIQHIKEHVDTIFADKRKSPQEALAELEEIAAHIETSMDCLTMQIEGVV